MDVQRITLIIICLLAAGCATVQHKGPLAQSESPVYADASAAALAFDPPITEGALHPEFARGPRAPAAFFGYTESTVEFYSSATDDLRGSEFGDLYTQEAISVKSGIRYR